MHIITGTYRNFYSVWWDKTPNMRTVLRPDNRNYVSLPLEDFRMNFLHLRDVNPALVGRE